MQISEEGVPTIRMKHMKVGQVGRIVTGTVYRDVLILCICGKTVDSRMFIDLTHNNVYNFGALCEDENEVRILPSGSKLVL